MRRSWRKIGQTIRASKRITKLFAKCIKRWANSILWLKRVSPRIGEFRRQFQIGFLKYMNGNKCNIEWENQRVGVHGTKSFPELFGWFEMVGRGIVKFFYYVNLIGIFWIILIFYNHFCPCMSPNISVISHSCRCIGTKFSLLLDVSKWSLWLKDSFIPKLSSLCWITYLPSPSGKLGAATAEQ